MQGIKDSSKKHLLRTLIEPQKMRINWSKIFPNIKSMLREDFFYQLWIFINFSDTIYDLEPAPGSSKATSRYGESKFFL